MKLIPVAFTFKDGHTKHARLEEDHYFLEAVKKGHNHFGMIYIRSDDSMMIVNSDQINYFIINAPIEVTEAVA